MRTHLVRQGQGQLDLVGGSLSVAAALDDGGAESGRAGGADSRSGNAEGVHGDDSWIGGALIMAEALVKRCLRFFGLKKLGITCFSIIPPVRFQHQHQRQPVSSLCIGSGTSIQHQDEEYRFVC